MDSYIGLCAPPTSSALAAAMLPPPLPPRTGQAGNDVHDQAHGGGDDIDLARLGVGAEQRAARVGSVPLAMPVSEMQT